jgi:hypothetical protein
MNKDNHEFKKEGFFNEEFRFTHQRDERVDYLFKNLL